MRVPRLILALGAGFFADKNSRQPVLIAVLLNDANQHGSATGRPTGPVILKGLASTAL